MVQRYENESKSQLIHLSYYKNESCFQWFKDTKMKANHNRRKRKANQIVLFPMVQRYENESKSQQLCVR